MFDNKPENNNFGLTYEITDEGKVRAIGVPGEIPYEIIVFSLESDIENFKYIKRELYRKKGSMKIIESPLFSFKNEELVNGVYNLKVNISSDTKVINNSINIKVKNGISVKEANSLIKKDRDLILEILNDIKYEYEIQKEDKNLKKWDEFELKISKKIMSNYKSIEDTKKCMKLHILIFQR